MLRHSSCMPWCFVDPAMAQRYQGLSVFTLLFSEYADVIAGDKFGCPLTVVNTFEAPKCAAVQIGEIHSPRTFGSAQSAEALVQA